MTIEIVAASGSSKKQVAVFIASGIWTVPSGVEVIEALIVGGGASGAAYSMYAGGGGGGCIRWQQVVVKNLTSVAIVVGSGGLGITAPSNGNDGGDSYVIDERFLAPGGTKGYISSSAAPGGMGGGFNISDIIAHETLGSVFTGGKYSAAIDSECHGLIRNMGLGAIQSGGKGGNGRSDGNSVSGDTLFGTGGAASSNGYSGGGGASLGPGGDYDTAVSSTSYGAGSAGSLTQSYDAADGIVYIFY